MVPLGPDEVLVICESCDGGGQVEANDGRRSACPTCFASGSTVARTADGFIVVTIECGYCPGVVTVKVPVDLHRARTWIAPDGWTVHWPVWRVDKAMPQALAGVCYRDACRSEYEQEELDR